MKEKNKRSLFFPLILVGMMIAVSCVDRYLPESLDSYDRNAGFTTTVLRPKLGRTQLITNTFNAGNSTLPMTYSITNITRADGSPAPELTEFFPVKVWTEAYSGEETSLQEINAKRATEYRTLFQVRKHSAEFILWSNAVSSFVKCAPDSSYVFDVLAENSGGYKYTSRMKLIPERESEFEPTIYDSETGLVTKEYVHPSATSGIYTEVRGYLDFVTPEDIQIYFRKNEDNKDLDKTLTFRFYTPDYKPISPAKFNKTDWASLVHGFNMEQTDEYVKYKVAYPIPLTKKVTKYTNMTGDRSHIRIAYDYLTDYGFRRECYFEFDFGIYAEANWEIIFVFASGEPLFEGGY